MRDKLDVNSLQLFIFVVCGTSFRMRSGTTYIKLGLHLDLRELSYT